MKFSRYQLTVVAILAFLQFTIVLDFMILPPPNIQMVPAASLAVAVK